ncbi:FGGY-family carbohydrate kinase [Fructobacillus ficulneus]|uniref:Sugar (Pentulose and hexulose) kinases n=1 Tax=Fructobacillus ficulneus TaxID=157463 RepID=A0A0K8MK68_9LACO|nr:FGGY-family carbohydrate kinase [Fructobacillus ficulneus]GAP00280.1 sugar (Pentulose and hexulose) kinases [Fructobacillus ficulneus]
MKTYLVIDVGTSSVRAILYDQAGQVLDQAQENYRPSYTKDGGVSQDALTFSKLSQKVIKKIMDQNSQIGDEIQAVAITAQRSSLIPCQAGQPLAPAIMWQDTRVNQILDRYRDYDEVFIQQSGSRLNAVYLGPKILWLKEQQPVVYEVADNYFNISSFLTYEMTGQATMDTTYGSRTNLMNIHTLTWDLALFKILGLDASKMPRLIAPGSSCGTVTKTYSRKTGLPAGIPVISAGGDQQCAALGAGLVHQDQVSINTGTGGYLIKNVDHLPDRLDGRLIYNQAAIPDKYILEIDLLACSSILNWFLENFYTPGKTLYQQLDEDLQACYGQKINVAVLPFHKGRSVGKNDRQIRSAFSNIGLSTRRQDLLYALMASLFVEMNKGLGIFKSLGPVGQVTISGGLTNSTIMNQMQADAYNLTVDKSPTAEATALGALMSVLVQQGLYPTFAAAAEGLIQASKDSYQPNPDNVDQFLAFDQRNQVLYQHLAGTPAGYDKGA